MHTLEYYTDEQIVTLTSGAKVSVDRLQDVEVCPDVKRLELEANSMMYDAQATKSQNLPSVNFDNTYTYTEFFLREMRVLL